MHLISADTFNNVSVIKTNRYLNMQKSKNRKFTCYFCNEAIENDTEMGHTAVCANVLVPCKNKCGSYVPRKDAEKHSRECLNRTTRSLPRQTAIKDNNIDDSRISNRSTFESGATNGYTHSLESYSNLKNELHKLSSKFVEFENNNVKSYSNNASVRQHLEALKNGYNQQKLELEKINYFNKILNEWKKSLDHQLDNLKQSITFIQKSKSDTDRHWITLQEKLLTTDKLQIDLNMVKDVLFQETMQIKKFDALLAQNLDNFKDIFYEEKADLTNKLSDQRGRTEDMKHEFREVKKILEEQRAKHTNIVFDVRATSQIASEAGEKIEIQEREFSTLKNEVAQMKLDLEMLDELISSQQYHTAPGILLWKISDLEERMKSAKDIGSVLKSPIFFSHDFGYKIRIFLYLNGLNKWKDRYALLAINVLKGEYDLTLKWPCQIDGSVTLKDLENAESPRPFSKRIVAKCAFGGEENEEPQESSPSYIFIPHTTLLKEKHVEDNTIFLEIKIDKHKIETHL